MLLLLPPGSICDRLNTFLYLGAASVACNIYYAFRFLLLFKLETNLQCKCLVSLPRSYFLPHFEEFTVRRHKDRFLTEKQQQKSMLLPSARQVM